MPVEILYDSIRPADDRQPVEAAVIEAVGNRSGMWKVWLNQGDDAPGFSIRIDGPDGAQFSYRFLKPQERSLEFVRMRIQQGLGELNGLPPVRPRPGAL